MTIAMAEFGYLQQLVRNRAAIVLDDDKAYLAEPRLHSIARELGLRNADSLIERVRLTRDRSLEDRVVEAMATNETLWFRDVHPFTALGRTVLPAYRRLRAEQRRLSVWSAACSSGQEMYSFLMTLADSCPDMLDWDLTLLGTDLSGEMVERAKQGSYSTIEINRGLPGASLVRHFRHEGSQFVVSDELRRRPSFRRVNLVQPWPLMPRFDIIFLRNVLIYFDVPTRQHVLTRAARCLEPDGLLLLGSTETLVGVSDLFQAYKADGATFYRLRGAPTSPSSTGTCPPWSVTSSSVPPGAGVSGGRWPS